MAVVIKIVFLFVYALHAVNAQMRCETPHNEPGVCVDSVQCPDYDRALHARPLTAENINFLRKVQCGYTETHPSVCCPNSGKYSNISVPLTPKKRRVRPPKPTPVEGLIETDTRFGEGNLLPSTQDCGKQDTGNRIFDGEITGIDEFPWMALLEYDGRFACGGVLINRRYVLTAAHCVHGDEYERLGGLTKVRLGEYNTEMEEDCIQEFDFEDCADPPVDATHESIIVHPEYDPISPDQHHDIALIRLNTTVKYTDFIKPICLPTKDFKSISTDAGEELYVSGWGKTEFGLNSPVKLKLKVPLVGVDECARPYSRFKVRVGPRQLCAGGERGRDSCSGDSGGPLMGYDKSTTCWYSLGVVSIGPSQCGTPGIPGVYTKVQDYIPWILQNVKA